MPENSIDSIVTDPPAGISFMGIEWDHNKGNRDNWIKWLSEIFIEAKRILKPGGHAFVWGLPRTSHWTAFALENAGFEIRDCVYHIFGTGFPKSLDISKAIDKQAGAKRKIIATINKKPSASSDCNEGWVRPWAEGKTTMDITAPETQEAKKWEGWGTALKPAVECWWLIRKPLSEKTVVENILKWGVGGLNIETGRIKLAGIEKHKTAGNHMGVNSEIYGYWDKKGKNPIHIERLKNGENPRYDNQGRWPANLIHDGSDEILAEFAKAGIKASNSGTPFTRKKYAGGVTGGFTSGCKDKQTVSFYGDKGSAARFFYCAKASKQERDMGINGVKDNYDSRIGNGIGGAHPKDGKRRRPQKNCHPTVKPLALMQYLIRLITPINGTMLDIFAGSGSHCVAAKQLQINFIGIELNPEYIEIARKRVESVVGN